LPGEFHEIHLDSAAPKPLDTTAAGDSADALDGAAPADSADAPDGAGPADSADAVTADGDAASPDAVQETPGPKVLLAFDLQDKTYAALADVGGMVPVQIGTTKAILIRSGASTVIALGRICTHDFCDMSPDDSGMWNAAKNQLVCTCHGSFFSADGKVTKGPAKTGLPTFPVTFSGSSGAVTE